MSSLILIGAEDKPSVAACLKLLKRSPNDLDIQQVWPIKRQGGFPGLMQRIPSFNKATVQESLRVLILTDLDENSCPVSYRETWIKDKGLAENANLIFRIAVREVESWALADAQGFAKFFRVQEEKITKQPEGLSDPKLEVINLLRFSKSKDIRTGCIPPPEFYSKTGPDYNHFMQNFFSSEWSPSRASKNAPSLRRAYQRIKAWH